MAKSATKRRTDMQASGTRLDRLRRHWHHMLDACGDPAHADYSVLGGMGATVCTDWNNNYTTFAEWALSHGYSDERWLIRVNIEQPYGPANCTWVVYRTYQRYLQMCRGYTAYGETKTLERWLRDPRCAVTPQNLRMRLQKGWPTERAISEPTTRTHTAYSYGRANIPVGTQFGRLTVISTLERIKYPRGSSYSYLYFYYCRCSCGTSERRVQAGSLLTGQAQSCGCLQRELARAQATVHGESRGQGTGTRLYRIWSNLNTFCHNPDNQLYPKFGLRGISVCSEWIDNFVAFRDWAQSHGYTTRTYLRRYDPKKDFTPVNCYWSIPKKQDNPHRDRMMLTAFGETRALVEWAGDPRCQVPARTLRKRISKGWEAQAAIATPAKTSSSRRYTAFNETKSLRDWANDPRCVVDYMTLENRWNKGWPAIDALTKPRGGGKARWITAFGETKRLQDWSRDSRCVVSIGTLIARLRYGWDFEKALTSPTK